MRSLMRKAFTILLLAAVSPAWADSLSSWEQQGIININFDEPVVAQSVVENQYRSDCSAADKGLDLFSISGDIEHQPRVVWADQDCLRIEPAPGSSATTTYTLRFRADARYLSGRSLQKHEYSFQAPASPLLHEDLRSCPNGAALLAARFQQTREAASLSPQTAIKYTYTRLKMDKRGDFFESGETAGAIVEQARLCHGNSFSVLQSLARRGIRWEELSQDSPLPGYVVVRPDRPVPAGSIWRLNAKAAPGSGIADSNLGPIYVNRSLSARLDQAVSDAGGNTPGVALRMHFNSLVEKADLQRAFREMELTLDGVETRVSEDGLSRTAMVNGREVRVRYAGEIAPQQFTIKPHEPENDAVAAEEIDDKQLERLVRYAHPTAARGMVLALESPVPLLVECRLKAGLSGIHGLPLESEFACRCSVTPLAPGLPQQIRHFMPLQGEHKLQLEAVNARRVRVRLRHWKVTEVVAAMPHIMSHLEQQQRRGTMALNRYERAVVQARINAGLSKPEDMPPPADNAERAREVYLGRVFLQAAGGTVVGQQVLDLPAGEVPLLGATRVQVDFDSLCGGQPSPGLYLVEMDLLPSEAVAEAARSMGMQPGDWELRCDALVSISDLSPLRLWNSSAWRHDLVVLSNSGKDAVHSGELIALRPDGSTIRKPLEQGFAHLPDGEAEILVRSGEDYCLLPENVHMNDGSDDQSPDEQELRAMLWTDRAIYRPGEKVHVRGFLRAVDGLNRISHSRHRTLELHFEAPDGSRLFSRTFDVDAYGAFSQELTLPAGQDDVCGRYSVRVGTTRPRTLARHFISCEVYRRDSFEAVTADKTKKIAPAELEFEIKARDLNNLPMNSGRAELRVRSHAPLKGARNVGSVESPRYEWQGTLPLGQEGNATFKLPLEEEITEDFTVQYEGAVVNEREESRVFAHVGAYAAAELQPELSEDDKLRLLCSSCGAPYHQGLSVRVAVFAPKRHESHLPNGFTLIEPGQEEVWSEWVNVPADTADGIQLALQNVLRQHADPDSDMPCMVEIKGRDYHGRVFRVCHARRPGKKLSQTTFRAETCAKPGYIRVDCGEESDVLLLLKYGDRVRLHTMALAQGYHEFALPLQGDEEGNVQVCVARLVSEPATGRTIIARAVSLQVQLPLKRSLLQVELEVPGVVRPATEQRLAGRVTLPDGSPSQAVVTLYAVDAGMLSQTPYERPDAVAALSRWHDAVAQLQNVNFSASARFREGVYLGPRQSLPGVWQGEGSLGGGAWAQQPWWMRSGGVADTATHKLMAGNAAGFYADNEVAAHSQGTGAIDAAWPVAAPRVRNNFQPVAVWCGALRTDADGRFATSCTLPDTLTTYRVFAVAADKGGSRFGTQEGEFAVNQPLILRAGLPLFMSVGDTLQLPVTVTNNTTSEGSWQVQLQGAGEAQQVTLAAGASATLMFEVSAQQPGTATYRWVATGATGQDAVEGSFAVRHPAPLLKEAHHLVLEKGRNPLVLRELLAAQVAGAPGCEVELYFSANPMLHLQGGVDFLLEGSESLHTETRASSLLPWLLYDRLAPLCPRLAQKAEWRVPYVIAHRIKELFKFQNEDGSLPAFFRKGEGSLWASAHAAVVLRLAEERGHLLPRTAWHKLLAYLEKADLQHASPLTRYEVARALQNHDAQGRALNEAQAQQHGGWQMSGSVRQDIEFLQYLRTHNEGRHEAFLRWMRSRAADYRYHSSWRSAWSLYALITYIGNSKGAPLSAALRLPDGRTIALNRSLYRAETPELAGAYSAVEGPVYAVLRAKAQPQQMEYPGVTECGLQITRLYEKKGEDGVWRPATEFAVGDVVRVALTCAKAGEQDLNHLVLEDYLPATMEAINPGVESQASGLESLSWSEHFDHREYLADRVRGFCTRWPGRDVVNMRYYARVKRAGSATAPPAQAQLYYEPQTYGLSPSTRVETR